MGLYEFEAYLAYSNFEAMMCLVLEAETQEDAMRQAVELLEKNKYKLEDDDMRVTPVTLPYSYKLVNGHFDELILS